MRANRKLPGNLASMQDDDPRDNPGGEVISLATRSVLPKVGQRKAGSEVFGLAAGVAIVAILGGLTLWTMDAAREVRTAPAPPANGIQANGIQATEMQANGIQGAPVPANAVTDIGAGQPAAPVPQAGVAAPPQPGVASAPAGNPYSSPTVVFDASALPVAISATSGGANGPAANATSGGEDFASRVGGVGGAAATATASIDPKTTVTQGTLIPAVLETAIDTDVPGYVRAIVSADVRSFDGTRVLVPRSSRLIGQYKSGMQAGQKRAYVIWTRLIRPDGVSVNIASPAVGFAGETGLAGKVNTHFFERFGSAMLLSVIGGLSAIGGNAGVIVASGGQSAAAAAVGQGAQISPTVRVRQGQPVRVFTARDLDFSKVSTQ